MFCHKCGEQLLEGFRFCSNCGERVSVSHEKQPTDVPLEASVSESQIAAEFDLKDDPQPTRRYRSLKKLPILIPIVSFLLVGGGVSASYLNESNKNEVVLSLQQSAETAALNGEYAKAEKALERALHIRPGYAVLEQNLKAVDRASRYTADLTTISENIREQNFTEAEMVLIALKEAVESEVDPLFEEFRELITAKEVTVTVGKIKQELSELTTVDQLADQLKRMATLPSEEAKVVQEQIFTKMVQISVTHAEKQLEDKHFSDAIATVNQGLDYVIDNKALLSVKEKIEQERAAFEQAEQTRMEQAMEAAAQEDLQNQTAAVEVTSFDYKVDEYGDLYLNGEIKNVATTDISSITIYYTVYDSEDRHLYDSSTSVYPFYVDRGEQASFEDSVFYLFEEVRVEIDNITWLVE